MPIILPVRCELTLLDVVELDGAGVAEGHDLLHLPLEAEGLEWGLAVAKEVTLAVDGIAHLYGHE